MKRAKFLLRLILFVASSETFAQSNTFSLSDWNKIVSLSSPSLSPDGKRALVISTRKNFDLNRNDSELHLFETTTKVSSLLIKDRSGLGAAKWSPSGNWISFLASANGRQLFILPAAAGESQQLTEAPGSIKAYEWNATSDRIAFILSSPAKKNSEPFNDSFEVGNHDFLKQQPSSIHTLWIYDFKTKQSKQVLPDSISVSTELVTSSLSWSSDGKKIIVTVFPSSNSGDSDSGRIVSVDVSNGQRKYLTLNKMFEGDGKYSEDGTQVAFLFPRDGVAANQTELHLIQAGSIVNVSQEIDHEISDYTWLANGELIFAGDHTNRTALWLRTATGKIVPLELGDVTFVSSWEAQQKGILLLGTERYRPAELYFKSSLNSKPIRLSDFNAESASRKFGKIETLSWSSGDEHQPNGIVTYPPDFSPLKKYPLALYIHGGPTAANIETFSAQAQAMAAQGWIVFQPNYRGSNNLGNKFQSAIANDPSEGPGRDVITGVEKLLKEPYVDAKRVGVSGWSYGGWMTNWLIGRYPNVWTAAVTGASPADFTDMYSLSDLGRMRRHAITESPFKGDNYLESIKKSPIVNFSKVRVPTLIMSNTDDYRVTVTGSYKLYSALRDNQVPVKFIAYPAVGHFPSDPVRYADIYKRWIEWFKIHLGSDVKEQAFNQK